MRASTQRALVATQRFRRTSAGKGTPQKVNPKKQGKSAEVKAKERYWDKLLSVWHGHPKDKRSQEKKDEWKQRIKELSKLNSQKENRLKHEEHVRIQWMLRALEALPEQFRKEGNTPDYEEPPYSMQGLFPGEIGPMPDSEVERLKPHVIDQTLPDNLREKLENVT